MIIFIICLCLFIATIILCLIGIFTDCDVKSFTILLISLIVSGILLILGSAGFVKQNVKAIEYPASKYDFKIKVVEFEEHRDTILVVTPKEKIK